MTFMNFSKNELIINYFLVFCEYTKIEFQELRCNTDLNLSSDNQHAFKVFI